MGKLTPRGSPAREGDLPNIRMFGDGVANYPARARQHRQQTGRKTGLLTKAGQQQRDPGAHTGGFTTTAFPAASAGATFCASLAMGEFHGVMAPTTPIGS